MQLEPSNFIASLNNAAAVLGVCTTSPYTCHRDQKVPKRGYPRINALIVLDGLRCAQTWYLLILVPAMPVVMGISLGRYVRQDPANLANSSSETQQTYGM